MGIIEIDLQREIKASPASVFRLLGDSSSWPRWTAIDSFEPITPPAADGTGEVREFRTGRVLVRERIVERIPERRLVYELLSGLAVRDYRAEIDLEPVGGGSRVSWHTTFKPKLPGTGWIYRRALEKATRGFIDGLAAQATRDGDPPDEPSGNQPTVV